MTPETNEPELIMWHNQTQTFRSTLLQIHQIFYALMQKECKVANANSQVAYTSSIEFSEDKERSSSCRRVMFESSGGLPTATACQDDED